MIDLDKIETADTETLFSEVSAILDKLPNSKDEEISKNLRCYSLCKAELLSRGFNIDPIEKEINGIVKYKGYEGFPEKEDNIINEQKTQNDDNIHHGYIKIYFSEKGYGFICDSNKCDEYFFHISNVKGSFPIIANKTKVAFDISENQQGKCAINIRQFFPKIEGEFGNIKLPNATQFLTNAEHYEVLKAQQLDVQKLLNDLYKTGLKTYTAPNGWISLNADEWFAGIKDIEVTNSIWAKKVPSGYPDTAEFIFKLLQDEITKLNRDYNIAAKGVEGEIATKQSLKTVAINYPILYNVRIEEGEEKNKFSAETDTIIITDRAIFLIETKNLGGKGDKIKISADGRWEFFDNHKKKSYVIQNNPYKQATDHKLVIQNFLRKHNFDSDLPIISLIAISNNNVELDVADNNITSLPQILRAELIGTNVSQYLDAHSPILSDSEMTALKNIFDNTKLPPKKYETVNYYENIKHIVICFTKFMEYYVDDYTKYLEFLKEKERQEKAQRTKNQKKEDENTSSKNCEEKGSSVLGFAIGILKVLLGTDLC